MEFQTKPITCSQLENLDTFTAYNFARDKHMDSNIVLCPGLLEQYRIDSQFFEKIFGKEGAESQHFLLTDSQVGKIYADNILKRIHEANYKCAKLEIREGEASKSIDNYCDLINQILKTGMDKKTTIVSLGGGVINNMAGMLCATLYRGIRLVHICTSMMSQVDAAIDFKQAINTCYGKNLVGAYHPASLIIIDPNAVLTMNERHVRNGISESIKHALCQDKEVLDYIVGNGSENVHNAEYLHNVVKMTLDLKVPTLNGDVADDFNEMVPQYGHCIGHAIEHVSKYEYYHGEAIAIGMCVSTEIALLLNIGDQATIDEHINAFSSMNLPCYVPDHLEVEDIIKTIKYDKHFFKSLPRMGLLTKIGEMYRDPKTNLCAQPIKYDVLEKALRISQEKGRIANNSGSESSK